jgi:hypothetical protein
MRLERSAETLLGDKPTARKSLSLAYIAGELGEDHELYDEIESYLGEYLEPARSMPEEFRSEITENMDDREIEAGRENLKEFLDRVEKSSSGVEEVKNKALENTGRNWLYFRADLLVQDGEYMDILQNRIER